MSSSQVGRASARRGSRHRQKGFSLLEVLVAFSVLAISLGVLYQAFGGGLRNLSVSGEYGRAIILAESRLAEVAARLPLEAGVDQGEENGMRWRVEVAPYEEIEELPRTFRPFVLVAVVNWGEGERLRRYRLQTLRLQKP